MESSIFKIGAVLLISLVSVHRAEKVETFCQNLTYNGPSNKPSFIFGIHSTNFNEDLDSPIRDLLSVCKANSDGSVVETFKDPSVGWEFESIKSTTKVAYDFKTKNYYWIYNSTVYKKKGTGKREFVANIDFMGLYAAEVHSLSLDWVSNNLYMYNPCKGVSAMRLDKPDKKVVKVLRQMPTDRCWREHGASIIVHPNKGYLFVQKNNQIERFDLDGKNNKTVVPAISVLPDERSPDMPRIVLDYFKDRIYWSSYNGSVYYSDLNGANVKEFKIIKNNQTHVFGLLWVDAKYVYYQNSMMSEYLVRRADKFTGAYDYEFKIDIKVDNEDMWKNFQFFHSSEQPTETRKDHPCQSSSETCKGLCFAIPGANDKLIKKCDDNFPSLNTVG